MISPLNRILHMVKRNRIKLDALIRKECQGKGTRKFKFRATCIAFHIYVK